MTHARRQRGLTLIELLVVLAILALMAGAVAFNLPPVRDSAKREAERFAALLDAASSKAIVDGRPMRIEISRTGYGFARFERQEWRADSSTTFVARSLDGVSIDVTVDDLALKNEPTAQRSADKEDAEIKRILLDPIGAVTPFIVDFASRRERWRVARAQDGSITVSENGRL